MNTNRITMQTRLAIAAAMLITSAGWVAAGESPTAKVGAAQLIQFHAPNNATPSVTVWAAKLASPVRHETQATKGGAARLIYLHAPNNATPAVTVWTGK